MGKQSKSAQKAVKKAKKQTRKRIPQPKDLPLETLLYLAFQRGLLDYKLLHHQKDLYKIVSNPKQRKIVINSTRRFGKTTVLLIYAFAYAYTNPGAMIRFVAPTIKTLKKNILPIIREVILNDCPEHFRPKYNVQDSCFIFDNVAELHLYGTDGGNHNAMRGQKTDLGVVDEGAYCSDLRYVIIDVLLPQTLTCNGRIILASTPNKIPTQSAEEFKQFCIEAESNGSYYTKNIYDNTSLTLETIEEYAQEAGGEESVSFQTEYMCKFAVDPEKQVVPDFNKFEHTLDNWTAPSNFNFYHKYVALDLGVKRDFTVVLFAYYDFGEATLYIQDEHCFKNVTSQLIFDVMMEKEQYLWGHNKPYRRITDNDVGSQLLVRDLSSKHNLALIPTNKSSLEAMVNEVRMWFQSNKIVIDSAKCPLLIRTLEHATWANNEMGRQRRLFARTESLGHMDALAALVYLIRNIDTTTNPVPRHIGHDQYDSYIPQQESRKKEKYKKMFLRNK